MSSKKSKLITTLIITPIILAVIGAAAAFGLYTFFTLPANPSSTTETLFVIKKGESTTSIAGRLEETGLIKNALVFKILVKLKNLGNKIQAGDFRLNPSMTTEEVAHGLTRGSIDIWVTLLEGWRREEMADALASTLGQDGSFDKQEFLNLTKNKEGFLFPETYLIPRNADAAMVVSILENTFEKQVSSQIKPETIASGRSLEDVIIMASILEREARGSARPIVAGILWKRLENDWPLQADATLQYVKGYDTRQKTWWPTPLGVDKELNSPYNTYKNLGLPPAPIASPSLDSIRAAANPTHSEYWFYITDLDGRMHYSVTLDEHNANVNKYLR